MEKFQNKYRIASTRLPKWDYGWDATYFVTICTWNREHYFGEIEWTETPESGVITLQLSKTGEIARQYWREILNHFPFVRLGRFVIMPNHIHGIIIIDKRNHPQNGETNDETNKIPMGQTIDPTNDIPTVPTTVKTLHATSQPSFSVEKNARMSSISPNPGTLGSVIRSYKSAVSKNAHEIKPDFAWQSNYHEHIIHDSDAYQKISRYIIDNPLNWKEDKFY